MRGKAKSSTDDEDGSSSCDESSLSEDSQQSDAEEESDEADEVNIADSIDLKIGEDGVSALAFHSSDRRLACGTMEGRVRIYDTEGNLAEPLIRGRYHKCVRCVSFHGPDHNLLLSGSSLGAYKLHDARTGRMTVGNTKAHSCGVNCLLSVNPDQFVSGDEDGHISLFDLRNSQSAVFSLHVQTDWRPPGSETLDANAGEPDPGAAADAANKDSVDNSGLCGVAHLSMLPGHLFAACEDGTLTTVSLNKRKILVKSEFYGHPLTSVWPMKGGAKVVATAESGSLLVFNRKELGNLSDKSSLLESHGGGGGGGGVEAACPVGPDVLVCACADGRLRAVSVQPHARLACLGRQPTAIGSCLRVVADPTGTLVASASPDSTRICLWSAGGLPQLARRQVELQRRNPSRRKRDAAPAAAPAASSGAAPVRGGKLARRDDGGAAASFLADLVGGE